MPGRVFVAGLAAFSQVYGEEEYAGAGAAQGGGGDGQGVANRGRLPAVFSFFMTARSACFRVRRRIRRPERFFLVRGPAGALEFVRCLTD